MRFFIFLVLISCGSRVSERYKADIQNSSAGDILISSGDVGLFSSFVEDEKGGIHIAYYDAKRSTLRWGYAPSLKTGFTENEIVDPSFEGEDKGLYSKIILDVEGRPNIFYLRRTVNSGGTIIHRFALTRAKRIGKENWEIMEIVNPCLFDTRPISLDVKVDFEGDIHIAYISLDKRPYYLLMRGDAIVECAMIDRVIGEFGGTVDNSISLDVDFASRIHISYYDSENGNLKYATKIKGTQSRWISRVVGWKRVIQEGPLKFEKVLEEWRAPIQYPSDKMKENVVIISVAPGEKEELPSEFWRFVDEKTIAISSLVYDPQKKYYISYYRTDTSPEDDGMFSAISFDKGLKPFVVYSTSKFTLEMRNLQGEDWSDPVIIDNVPISDRISLTTFGERRIPVVVYPDSARGYVKSAFQRSDGKWIISPIITEGANGFSIFAKSIGKYVGVSYVRLEKGEYQLRFTIFEVPQL